MLKFQKSLNRRSLTIFELVKQRCNAKTTRNEIERNKDLSHLFKMFKYFFFSFSFILNNLSKKDCEKCEVRNF